MLVHELVQQLVHEPEASGGQWVQTVLLVLWWVHALKLKGLGQVRELELQLGHVQPAASDGLMEQTELLVLLLVREQRLTGLVLVHARVLQRVRVPAASVGRLGLTELQERLWVHALRLMGLVLVLEHVRERELPAASDGREKVQMLLQVQSVGRVWWMLKGLVLVLVRVQALQLVRVPAASVGR